ncbi:hypothetical protein MBEHAL_1694 [Halarchaeum acidiphilum MH1-52-1]|uniref:Uncharacterized protein n=1 Tax=Halarchaeum acidiphilum MH1-52-1 TaxID=1261545 RepID=U3A5L4_9EURY|nr:DUF5518 domain-containing protein [Halarchaeum acidiphilum]GAD52934.1 hypothetical protein MBEHAL_1694 [Halarchaeum acidiphilum MH1-52-1]
MALPTDRLPGGAWTYALPAGLLSLPLTVLGYARTGPELALAPVVVCGLCAGYLARRETGTTDGVGTRTGALGGAAGAASAGGWPDGAGAPRVAPARTHSSR